jgi:HAD superfamily hydrolase (TIGR01509 family)
MKQISFDKLAVRKHWVFDLDGTLTVAVHDFADIRQRLGIPTGSDILGHLASLPSAESQLLHTSLQKIEDGLAEITSAATGALQLLEILQARGANLGILTRNTRDNALRTLERAGLDRYFDPAYVLGRDEALPKPDPDGIHRLSDCWGTAPETTVMVGDYHYDLQAGRSAGSLTVHVDVTGSFRWPELADVSVVTLGDLFQRIQAGGSSQERTP